MNRRDFLRSTSAAGMAVGLGGMTQAATGAQATSEPTRLRAGFARVKITPPLGTRMMGFGFRDYKQGCQCIHDDIYVRAVFLQHRNERVLILAYDLCFLGREEADRFKGMLGREFDLAPRQILLNTSHNHLGPMVGTWYWAGVFPPDRVYLNRLADATLAAARKACDDMRDATMSTGVGRTTLPMCRRRPDGKGGAAWAPNPHGKIYDRLPVCRLTDLHGKPIVLMFSVSAHPSMMAGWDISADYPGVACRLLDEHLGTTAAMFLQGCGGDANTSIIGEGAEKWRMATWEEVEQAGRLVADETIRAMEQGLSPVEPNLRSAVTEMRWPLQALPPRSEMEAVIQAVKPEAREGSMRYQWAARMIEMLERDKRWPADVGITLQVMRLGEGLTLAGLEGEPVAGWGDILEKSFKGAGVFPLGYCNGQGLYLPVSSMLPEGGYEVESYWEYGLPAPLAPGMEQIVAQAIASLS